MFHSTWSKFRALPIAAQVIVWVLIGGFVLGLTGVLQPPRSASASYPTQLPTYIPSTYATPTYSPPTPTVASPPPYTAPTTTYEAPVTTGDSGPVYVNPPNIGDGHDHHPLRHQVCKHSWLC